MPSLRRAVISGSGARDRTRNSRTKTSRVARYTTPDRAGPNRVDPEGLAPQSHTRHYLSIPVSPIRVFTLALTVAPATALALLLAPAPALAGVCGTPTTEAATGTVAFTGEALDGTADPSTGELVSPATFRVERWTTGDGADEVRVETAVTLDGTLIQKSSIGIAPRAGERWRIRGRVNADGILETTICDGSERVISSVPAEHDPSDAPPTPVSAPAIPDPGDDRILSLAVAAVAGTALVINLGRRSA